MLHFKKVTLCDKSWVRELVMAENSPSADYNFGNIYIWDKNYSQLISRYEDRVLVKLRYAGQTAFVYPVGRGPVQPAIEALRDYAQEKGVPFRLRGITEKHRAELETLYPGRFRYAEDVANADYIYDVEKLSSYAGKALHSKKNHCNRFEAENAWRFVPLTRELIPACMDMLDLWEEENKERLDKSIVYEHVALTRAFAAFEHLDLEGGVLYAGDRIAGFSLGEMTSDDTFDVHFEKAQAELNGAYPMVCRELTRMMKQKHPALRYMNREDDMGLESLRRSKLSYRPEFMLKKFTADWVDDDAAADR